MESSAILYTAIFVVILNLVTTVFIVRSSHFDKQQKLLQVIVVWLIPLFAAVGILLFLRSMKDDLPVRKRQFGGGPQDSGHT